MIVQRTNSHFLEKKPGANLTTKIIFVRMLRRIGHFREESDMRFICDLGPRFNDALNDSGAKLSCFILTINSCNAYEHFEKSGNLSKAGKVMFWQELDDLIYRFDANKVKLLPNPKNPPSTKHNNTSRKPKPNWFTAQRNYNRNKQQRSPRHNRNEVGHRLQSPPMEHRHSQDRTNFHDTRDYF